MSVFDQFFFKIFHHYKPKQRGKKATRIAIFFISFLQISLLLLVGIFFAIFFKQMHVDMMSSNKAWTLFVLSSVGIHFKNWIQYNGKKRKVLNAKSLKNKPLNYSMWMLWLLPIACLSLALIINQAF